MEATRRSAYIVPYSDLLFRFARFQWMTTDPTQLADEVLPKAIAAAELEHLAGNPESVGWKLLLAMKISQTVGDEALTKTLAWIADQYASRRGTSGLARAAIDLQIASTAHPDPT